MSVVAASETWEAEREWGEGLKGIGALLRWF